MTDPPPTQPPPTEPYLPTAPQGVPSPDQIGDCRLVREIGRGGMGVVYEAVQGSLGRRVAVKVLPPCGDSARERFHREAQAAARLHHTNIVPVFAHGDHLGQSYYVMQLIPGVGLDKVLAARAAGVTPGPSPLNGLPPAEYDRAVARVGTQVADALAYAHAHGVLHRDIKPANLLLDDRGTVWVTDFGVAKVTDDPHHTRTGEVVGTLYYMPPERLGGQSDARGDVYSLGVTLFELLTGRSAFPDTTPEQLVKRIPAGLPTRPREVRPDIPADLETIVLKATAADAAWRYQTAAELADDLRRFLDDRPVTARRAGLVERAWQWARREPRLAAATGAAGVLLAAVAGLAVISAFAARGGERREAALKEKQAELRRSDQATARVALDGLNQTLDYLTPTRLTDRLTPDQVPAVEKLLRTYTTVAEACEKHPEFVAEAAEARRRIGDLAYRLGRFPEANAAYSAALEYEETATDPGRAVRVARLHNGRGRTLRALQQFDAEADAHRAAVNTLTAGGEPAADRVEERYELAFAYYSLGRRNLYRDLFPIRPAIFPYLDPRLVRAADPGREEYLRKAVAVAGPLSRADPRADRRHLWAACAIALPPGEGDDPADLLRELVQNHQSVPEFRVALCEALARPTPTGPPADDRLAEAVTCAARLCQDYPSVPAYRYAHGRYLDWRGIGRLHAHKYAQARPYHQEAVDCLGPLAREYPGVAEYRLGLGFAEASVARAMMKQNPPATAAWEEIDGRYRTAVGRVEPLLAGNDRLDGVRSFLNITYQEWAAVQTKLARTDVAQEYKKRADSFAEAAPRK